MSVFITGGSGFVGLNLIEQLLARGDRVVSFSLTPPPGRALRTFDGLPGAFQHIDGDVCDARAVAAAVAASGARRLIHAAVITAGIARERRESAAIVSTNVDGAVNVLEAALRSGIERFLYLSSASVYGANALGGNTLSEEHTAPLPVSLYAVTKYAAEGIARRFGAVFEMQVVAARLSAVFGRWEYDTGLRDTLSPPFLLTRMAAAGEPAVLVDDGLRDWIYAPDAAAGILALMDAATLRHDLYNVSTGRVWSLRQWCEQLVRCHPAFSYRVDGTPGSNAVIDPGRRSPLAIERIAGDTGFQPRYGLEESFNDYLQWLRG